MKKVRGWAGAFALVLAAIILGELPVMKELDHFIKDHEFWWLVGIGSTGVIGFALLMGGILHMIVTRGEPISHEDAEDLSRSVKLAARPTTWRASAYRIWGTTAGGQAHDEFSFRAMKDAWRSGAWRRELLWQRRFVTTVGGLMTFIGLFGLFFVIGPTWMKVLMGGAMLYASVRLTWGFWQA